MQIVPPSRSPTSAQRLVLLCASLLALSPGGKAAGDDAAVLTTAQQVRSLDRVIAMREQPVRAAGVITFVSPENGGFVLDDGTAGIFVAMNDAAARGWNVSKEGFTGALRRQARVEVEGVSGPGAFAPVILPRKLRYLGEGSLPPVKAIGAAELQTGCFDCERVRVRGVVQRAEIETSRVDPVHLELGAIGGHFVAYASESAGFEPAVLVDSEVEISGVALSFYNDRGELVGARVQAQSIQDVAAVQAAPAGPFAAPEARFESLLPFSPVEPLLHRRKLTGIVTVCRRGSCFYIQEGDRAVRVDTRDDAPLVPGDRVEVSGFIEMRKYFAELRESVFRRLGHITLPPADPITWSAVLDAKPWLPPNKTPSHLDGRRVTLTGRMSKVEDGENGERRITLECENHTVVATVADRGSEAAWRRLIPGSDVRVTGVCQVELSDGRPTATNPLPVGFQMLLQSPDDIIVTRRPSWWTVRRLLLALAGAAAIIAGVSIWAALLKRRVAQRSAQLAAEIGARQNAEIEFAAVLRERRRLAADLHDTVEQALISLSLQLEAVDLFHGAEPNRAKDHLHLARQFLARSREDVRRSVWDLRAQGLEKRTFVEALRDATSARVRGETPRVTVETDGDPFQVPDFIASNLLLLCQEAVTNALKHSGAREVRVRVEYGKDSLALTVQDDGSGFDPAHAPGQREGHFGLQGMRERMKRLQGRLSIESHPGSGTTIVAEAPISAFQIAGNGETIDPAFNLHKAAYT